MSSCKTARTMPPMAEAMTAQVRVVPAVLSPQRCAEWLDTVEHCAAALPSGHADLQAASGSLRLQALGRARFISMLGTVAAALGSCLPREARCLTAQCWARRQHPPASRPAGQSPHGWHQDGALHSRFTASPDDALLAMTTVWIPLVDCGDEAPSLEWIDAPLPALIAPGDLLPVAERHADRARQARLAAGDALVFGGALLHRTHVTPRMSRRRVSLEWRFVGGDPQPTRLAHEPREP